MLLLLAKALLAVHPARRARSGLLRVRAGRRERRRPPNVVGPRLLHLCRRTVPQLTPAPLPRRRLRPRHRPQRRPARALARRVPGRRRRAHVVRRRPGRAIPGPPPSLHCMRALVAGQAADARSSLPPKAFSINIGDKQGLLPLPPLPFSHGSCGAISAHGGLWVPSILDERFLLDCTVTWRLFVYRLISGSCAEINSIDFP